MTCGNVHFITENNFCLLHAETLACVKRDMSEG